MLRKELKVLIVEDDLNSGRALNEGLQRAGYQTTHLKHPKEVLQSLKLNSYHLIILDCLLPETNGVELAKQIRKDGHLETRIIFTSGIFKDQKFIKTAMSQTDASQFLVKPFSIDELKTAVDEALKEFLEEDRDPHMLLLQKQKITTDMLLEAIIDNDVIHAFQLPYYVSILSENTWTGTVKLTPVDQPPAEMIFKNGKITDFLMKDVDSYFGVLLIEMGYAISEDVQTQLSNQKDKRLGQLLLENHSVSPHAVELARLEQILVRLSKLINNQTLQIELDHSKRELGDPALSHGQIHKALQEWVSSKISESWLRQFYYSWMEHPLKLTDNLDNLAFFRESYFLQSSPQFLNLIGKELSLAQLLDLEDLDELLTLQTVHFGICSRNLFFGPRVKTAKDYVLEFNRLKKMTLNLEEKNHFEVLGLPQAVNSNVIQKTYTEIARYFHPDKIDPKAPPEFKDLANHYFTRVTTAYEILKDEAKRNTYKKTLEIGQLKEILQTENHLEECRNLIRKGQYKEALIQLQALEKQPHHQAKTKLLIAWARLKNLPDNAEAVGEILNKFQKLMHSIPPEDRHSLDFFFVKGLYYRLIGQHGKAASYFKNCLALDPTFSEAKSELIRAESKTRTHSKTSFTQLPNLFSRMIKKSS